MATQKQREHRVKKHVLMSELYAYLTSSVVDTYRGATQVKCHIHGEDNKPSARIYEDTNKMYCFTCRQTFDPFSYARAYRGIPFSDYGLKDNLLLELEKVFNLNTIPLEEESLIDKASYEGGRKSSWDSLLGKKKKWVKEDPMIEADYSSLFKEKWLEVNQRAIDFPDIQIQEKVYKGLDLALLSASGPTGVKKAWEFLFKLENKFMGTLI